MFFSDSRLDGDPQAMQLAYILAQDPSRPQERQDADQIGAATLFTLRQLQMVRSKIQKVDYPENRCATFVPLATDIPALIGQYVYMRRDYAGQSRLQNGNAKGPIPRIDNIKTGELIGHVYALEGSYGWQLDELRQAARLSMDLPSVKAECAREVIARDTDEVTRTGTLQVHNDDGTAEVGNLQSTGNMGGFVNHPNVPLDTTSPAVSLHKWFASATTPEQMAGDLAAIAQAVNFNTKTIFPPKTMLMATALYNIAATTRMSSASAVTVLKYFLDNNPYITEIDQWIYLDGAGASKDAAASNRIICYSRNADILENVNPIDFETQPAQVEGFQYIIPCRGLVGAVKIYRPNAMMYADISVATS